jgi:hypothetical protein
MENTEPSSSEKFLLPSKRTKYHDFCLIGITPTLMDNERKRHSMWGSNDNMPLKWEIPKLEDLSTKEHYAGQANAGLFIVHLEHS